jgi:FAD binding domain of DNA photolyase
MIEATASAASFPPTLAAAHARLAAIHPADYARSRDALDGAVTRLSPYITHGFVTLPEALSSAAVRHRFGVQHKFVFELGWREFFRHVWQHHGDRIFASLHAGPLPEDAYAPELPADIREARTGVPVIDRAVRTLYATGYLHNHARMWLASYGGPPPAVHAGADGVDEPARLDGSPVAWPVSAPDAAAVADRDVWLVHPWSLREAPPDLPPNTLHIGLWPAAFHRRWPWSVARWAFAGARLAELAPRCWHADTPAIAQALRSARSVQMQADPHLEPALLALAVCRPEALLFTEVDRPCASFAQWWKRATRDARELHELPGAASLPTGPQFDADHHPPCTEINP